MVLTVATPSHAPAVDLVDQQQARVNGAAPSLRFQLRKPLAGSCSKVSAPNGAARSARDHRSSPSHECGYLKLQIVATVPIIEPSAAAAERIEQRHARSRGVPHSHPCRSLPDDRATPAPRHIRASCACRFPRKHRVGAVAIATSRGRRRDRSSSHGRRRQMSAPPLTEPPRETTAFATG